MVKLREFLEVGEDQDEEDAGKGIPPQFVRVTANGMAGAQALLATIKPMFAGRRYTATLHQCFHDAQSGASCQKSQIEKVAKKGAKPVGGI